MRGWNNITTLSSITPEFETDTAYYYWSVVPKEKKYPDTGEAFQYRLKEPVVYLFDSETKILTKLEPSHPVDGDTIVLTSTNGDTLTGSVLSCGRDPFKRVGYVYLNLSD